MRDFFIDYIVPFLAVVAIGGFIMQFTDSLVVIFSITWPLYFLFGFFVYPHIANLLRG